MKIDTCFTPASSKLCAGSGLAVCLIAAAITGLQANAAAPSPASPTSGHAVTETPVRTERLPNVPGETLSAVLVTYAPGAKSPRHHHAGSVFAFVVSGSIRSENSATGPARVFKAGESFFEPPGSVHRVSENASNTEPAQLLAVFVADDGARLTVDEP